MKPPSPLRSLTPKGRSVASGRPGATDMRLGVCYYPEHWPEAWWAEDARQMVALGLRQVRIGEFAWSRIEPVPGRFDWAWLDRAIDTLAAAGLEVVLGTPTATPPKWLVDRDPSMLAVGADGRVRAFGSRRHYDFSSDAYLAEAVRITRAMAERYGRHPAVIAWQTDNEYGCHDTVLSFSANAQARFRRWLQARYGSIDALNTAWGTAFWSQEVASFDAIDAPIGAVTEAHPAQRLDYRRFASDEVLRFNRAQCDVLRALSPGRTLTHNAMLFFTEYDHHALAADLDVMAWDSYPLGALENFWFDAATQQRWLRTGHPDFAAFHHDLYRGMSKQPFWVMEQQPGPVNWGRWNPAPAPGMVRLWTWEAFAHGADVVSYFRWRQAPFAQEQMHAGLQTPDRMPDLGAEEARAVADELLRVEPQACARAAVALVFDYPSLWAMQVQPQGADENPLRVAFDAYSALRSLGLDVDVVGPAADLSDYALIVLPAQAIVDEPLVRALLASRAQIVLYPRSGAKEITLRIPEGLPPGPLRRLIDLRVTRVESLRPKARVRFIWNGRAHEAERWREFVQAAPHVAVEARFDDGHPALLRQGRTRYVAARGDAAFERRLLEAAALDAGLAPVRLPEGLRLRRRGDLLFVINYGHAAQQLRVPQAQWLVGTAKVPAHGVSIARRRSAP
jgi:beta-galactosidase